MIDAVHREKLVGCNELLNGPFPQGSQFITIDEALPPLPMHQGGNKLQFLSKIQQTHCLHQLKQGKYTNVFAPGEG